MNLFLKIFLWFLAAIAMMVGTIVFLDWTVQTEPVVSRWRSSVTSQMTIYAATAEQIHRSEGDDGLMNFLDRIRSTLTVGEVSVFGTGSELKWGQPTSESDYAPLVGRAFDSADTQIDTNPQMALAARSFLLADGEEVVLVLGWSRPKMTPFFGEPPFRYFRFGAVLVTALLLCWALAKYLSSPIETIRRATRKLAKGELQTRVGDEVGSRRDELESLAKDFDLMAERIESLVTSQQRLSRDVSHELRSPLARLNVALEIAKQRSNAETMPILERIEKESTRLNEMISQLLTLSKLESGSSDFERHEVNFTALVRQIAADADFEAIANGKELEISAEDDLHMVGNERLLRSAVENVLRNAVRYTAEGTAVQVDLRESAGSIVLDVTDHGGGVPANEIDNLFRPFYRIGEARERKTGGIGLGLAIAEQAVRLHKGTIVPRNTADGLSVTIEFPSNDLRDTEKAA